MSDRLGTYEENALPDTSVGEAEMISRATRALSQKVFDKNYSYTVYEGRRRVLLSLSGPISGSERLALTKEWEKKGYQADNILIATPHCRLAQKYPYVPAQALASV